MKTKLIHLSITLWSCVTHVTSEFQCQGTCYSGSFPKNNDVVKGKRLAGYSYKNITTDVPQTCFSSCVNDCRCNACQMKDVRCELLDEDKTSKAADFATETGYVYYDLQQTIYKGSHMVQPAGECYNGCCITQSCMNGGTCVELCDKPKEKFTCKCPAKYYGKMCENERQNNSCIDVLKTSVPGTIPAKGTYIITRSDTKTTVPVYCAFDSPNQAWTLIESFSIHNLNTYKQKAFHQDFHRNIDSPQNWTDYRASLDMTKYIRSKAAMYRATCDYPNRGNDISIDSLIGYLSEYDLINRGDLSNDGECIKFSYINIRGQEFVNTSAALWHTADRYHPHLDCYALTCGGFYVSNAVGGDDCFGLYNPIRSGMSKCTATQQSTTQWWLGEQQ